MSTVTQLDRPPGAVTVHEPHGFVALVEQAGSDLSVVNAARVSYAKQSAWVDIGSTSSPMFELSDADEGLINFLMKGRHGTPFEQNYFQFHISAPIFVFREWHRHRIGISINEMSGRYVELPSRFYLPDDEHVRVQVGKPGNYGYAPKGAESMYGGGQTYGEMVRTALQHSYDIAWARYRQLLDAGIAKEIARACLPVAIYSEMLWSCNARSLMNFLSLRNHSRALREIRDYAEVMEDLFARAMPYTHAAFVANGRVAP
jgi:thymidylate synthase (FAD)